MGNVISILGTDSRVGVSMFAQDFAECLGRLFSGKKVLLLHLDGNEGMDYLKEQHAYGLDDLKAQLFSGILTAAEIMDTCVVRKNLWIQKGTAVLSERKFFHPEHVALLVKIAREEFDIIVIDAGSNLDMGLVNGALIYSDYQLLITTQSRAQMHRFLEKKKLLEIMGLDRFDLLIVNQFLLHQNFLQPNDLKDMYELSCEAFAIDWSNRGWEADQQSTTLFPLDSKYRKTVNEITAEIGRLCGDEGQIKLQKPKKSLLWKRKKEEEKMAW